MTNEDRATQKRANRLKKELTQMEERKLMFMIDLMASHGLGDR